MYTYIQYIRICMYVCMHVCMRVGMHKCEVVSTCVGMWLGILVCMSVCMYVGIHGTYVCMPARHVSMSVDVHVHYFVSIMLSSSARHCVIESQVPEQHTWPSTYSSFRSAARHLVHFCQVTCVCTHIPAHTRICAHITYVNTCINGYVHASTQ